MARSTVHLLFAAIVLATLFGGPSQLNAQSGDAERTEDLIDSYDSGSSGGSAGGLPEATVSRVNLDLNVRHWRESLQQGKPADDRLDQLVADARGFGYANAPDYATAIRHSLESHSDKLSVSQATGIFESVQSLSPDLPYGHLAEARFLLEHHPAEINRTVGTYLDGLSRAFAWPNTGTTLSSYGLLAVIVLLAAGFGIVLAGQLLRHLPIAAHDIARRLPQAVSRGQILAVLVVSAGAATLATDSYLVGGFGLVAVASVSQEWSERLVAIAACLFVAALPYADAEIERLAGFSGSKTQARMEAQYLRCDEECRGQLADQSDEGDNSPLLRYTQALALVRTGKEGAVDRAAELIEEPNSAPSSVRGYFLNLRGAALLAAGRTDAAIEHFQQATASMTNPVPAWFNLMRAARRAERDELASRASTAATNHDADAVQQQSESDRDDPASHLMLTPLPLSFIWDAYRAEAPAAWSSGAGSGTIVSQFWAGVTAPNRPLARATLIGSGAALLLLLLSLLSLVGLSSSPCPNCGLAREPDDAEQTGGHPHCLPCYRTFVGGAELGYRARVHYETLLGRRSTLQTILRRVLSVVLPGAGHALAGRVLGGFALAATLGAGLFVGLYPDWLWQPPRSTAGPDFLGLRWLGWLLVSGVVLVAVWTARRDVAPLEPSSNSNRSRRRHD